MTYTRFLKLQGNSVGQSKVESDKLDVASRLLQLAGDKLVLPKKNHLVATKPEAGEETKVVSGSLIPDGWFGMDIGPETIALYEPIIKQAGTVVWNSPMGKFEVPAFRREGTRAIAEAAGRLDGRDRRGRGANRPRPSRNGAWPSMTHVSTSGGTFLESLEGKSFNSLKVIPDKS